MRSLEELPKLHLKTLLCEVRHTSSKRSFAALLPAIQSPLYFISERFAIFMSGSQLFPSPSLPDSSGWNNQRLSRGDSEVTQMPWENRRWCALWVALSNMAARSPLPSPHRAVLNKKQVAAAFCFACPDVFLIKWLVRPPPPETTEAARSRRLR